MICCVPEGNLKRFGLISDDEIDAEVMMYVNVQGLGMAYSDAGKGVPLLFVHGYPLNRKLWGPQLEDLSTAARTLAPDLRGHGDSQAMPGPYSMDLFADDLNAFLDALGIRQPVIICGLSMGGYVAFAFYRKYAPRVAGMILTATRAAADTPEARAGRDQSMVTARQQGARAIVEGMLPKMLSPKTFAGQPELVSRVREIMLNTSLEGVLGDLEGLKKRPDSTQTLREIRVPVLLLPGEDDVIVPLHEAEEMFSILRASNPGAFLEVIPGAAHLPNLENSAVFNQSVRRFVTSIAEKI
jgi:pimeloyl-ACP methyl ester carboxylesterase